jgi:hypothetical protein
LLCKPVFPGGPEASKARPAKVSVAENPYVNTAKYPPSYKQIPPPFSAPKLTKVSVAELALSYAMRSAGNPSTTTRTAGASLDQFVMQNA